MGFESIDQPGWSSEVERNPKMSILFFWLERGGRWGSSPLTSLADHQKLNVIQKWAFYFLAAEGWQMGFESIIQPSWSSEVERNPKMSILYFWLERGDRWGSSPSTSPADHQKLNIIQKWAFHIFGWRGVMDRVQVHWPARLIIRSWMKSKNEHFIFWLERGGRWGLSPLPSPADHQKLNVIQKWAFYFFGWKGVVDRIRVHWPAQLIIKSWT